MCCRSPCWFRWARTVRVYAVYVRLQAGASRTRNATKPGIEMSPLVSCPGYITGEQMATQSACDFMSAGGLCLLDMCWFSLCAVQ